jgi:iron complex outermembrane receptor protein
VGCFIPGPQFDPASLCHPGDPIHNTVDIGSNGFPGYGPLVASHYARDSWAAYFDVEADLTSRFLATVAGRYEDFSDFGSNFSFRVAARFQLNEALALRASAGTGFRAPTPGQISTTNLSTIIDDDGQPKSAGIFPADHPVSQFFGSAPLTDETSTQLTLGFAAAPTESLTLTLDYYLIAVDDQLQMSSPFLIRPSDPAVIRALGISQASFFTNDIDTETSGVDLVGSYNVDWTAGSTVISVAANYSKSDVTRRTNRQSDPDNPAPVYYFSDSDVFRFRHGSPGFRANITGRHSWAGGVTASVRGNWYGDYKINNRSLTFVQDMAGKMFWDLDVTWEASEAVSITVGANNLTDEFPDRPERTCCGRIYDTNSVMDWQGSYYFVRGVIRWN